MRLLLVEDHEDTVDLMSRLLKARGHAVVVARTVGEAREQCREGRFDLVVTDIQFRDGTGWELMSEVFGPSGVPAVALSGHGSPDDLARSREAGFAAHLTKPVAIEALEKAIAGATAGADESGKK
jgi:CheY-like chemotaxis protein